MLAKMGSEFLVKHYNYPIQTAKMTANGLKTVLGLKARHLHEFLNALKDSGLALEMLMMTRDQDVHQLQRLADNVKSSGIWCF